MDEPELSELERLDLRIPITIGACGHIDIRREDFPILKESVAEIFKDLQERFPRTPLVLLSSLAPGADQLTAEVALDLGVKLLVPLPFPPTVYARSSTFCHCDPERERMQEILALKNVESFVVPLPDHPDELNFEKWEAIANDESMRRTCYANVGGYIVRHCQALIALWDGQPPVKPSGTAEMVRCKHNGVAPNLYPWREPLLFGAAYGPVFVVHSFRAGPTEPLQSPISGFKPGNRRILMPPAGNELSPEDHRDRLSRFQRFRVRIRQAFGRRRKQSPERAEWTQFNEICQAIEEFNRDARRVTRNVESRFVATRGSELWQRAAENLLPGPTQRLILLRVTAATLANRQELYARGSMIMLFALLFLAGLFLDCYAHLEFEGALHQPGFVMAFAVCLVGAVFVVALVWACGWHEKRLDYRAFAEALRVCIFWGVAGINESVADAYLGQVRNEMVWARRALQAAAPPVTEWRKFFWKQPRGEQLKQLRLVLHDWVVAQESFFQSWSHELHRGAVRLRWAGFLAALLGWFISLGFIVSYIGWIPLLNAYRPEAIWLIASGVLVLGGGLLIAYCERRSHEELSKQYERMRSVFSRGLKEIEGHIQTEDVGATQEVLRALGHEAIMENAQWLILRRNRPFELVIV